jgi:putative glutamine amidotransferase
MTEKVAVLYRNTAKIAPYLDAVRLTGLNAIPVAPGAAAAVSEFAGLVLTGGNDVDASLYGQLRHPETQLPDRDRDDFEIRVLREMVRADRPVLAICRGLQLLNVAFGGTLIQDLPDSGVAHRSPPSPLDEAGKHPGVHSIEVGSHGQIAAIYGAGVHQVNSRHHQAVDRPGEGIVVVARAADGVVEACEMPAHRFIVAVQWHPEDRVHVSDRDRGLFEAFARAVQKR